MKPISDFFPWVLPHLPGCSLPLVTQCIRDAAITFCETTDAIRQPLDPLQMRQGVSTYTLEAPSQQQVVRVLQAQINSRALRLAPIDAAPMLTGQTGEPSLLHVTRTDGEMELVLTPTPDKDSDHLLLQVSLRPTRSALMLSNDLFDLWAEGIAAGAIGMAQRIPAQPFSDPTSAAQRHAEFRSHITRARINASNSAVRGSQRVNARPFA